MTKRIPTNPIAVSIAGLAASVGIAVAEPVTHCMPSAEGNLRYTCSVVLDPAHGAHGAPVQGAVNITMPSMPLAHNVPPAELAPDPAKHGTYTFETELEMFGEWMFTYELSAPERDQFRHKLMFMDGATASSGDTPEGGDHNEHGHSEHDHSEHDHSGHDHKHEQTN